MDLLDDETTDFEIYREVGTTKNTTKPKKIKAANSARKQNKIKVNQIKLFRGQDDIYTR